MTNTIRLGLEHQTSSPGGDNIGHEVVSGGFLSMVDSDEGDSLGSVQNILIQSGLDVGIILIGGVKGANGIEYDGDRFDFIDFSFKPLNMFRFQEVELSKFLPNLPLADGVEVTEGVSSEDLLHVFVNTGNRHISLKVEDVSVGVDFEIKKSGMIVADSQCHPQCEESLATFGIAIDEETAFNGEELFDYPGLLRNFQRHELRNT